MALIVQKFGGTSVGDIERIKNVANIVAREKEKGNDVVVVVSAMSGVTSQLVGYANEVSNLRSAESLAEYDSVISSGEQVTSGLLALELQSRGICARSFLGWQAGIKTCVSHSKSRIEKIDTKIFKSTIESGCVPVVAGFQGIAEDNRITTMGRGGSDTSAVAVAAALKADRCDIYTDVTGVFTADPRVVKNARKLEKVGYEEVLEMASLGAKVLQIRSVKMAIKHDVKVQVLSSFQDEPGTLLVNEEDIMERKVVTAVAHSDKEARVTLNDVNNEPGVVAKIFEPLANAEINLDMIIQNISYNGKKANVTFTLDESNADHALEIMQNSMKNGEFEAKELIATKDVSKVSVVGIGMIDHSGIAQKMFQTLADNNINILAITTSEIKISILVAREYTELAVRLLHDAFNLGEK